MMIESYLLVEGRVDKEMLRSLSLSNAKQLVVGHVAGTETILHLAATSHKDLSNAIREIGQLEGVKSVTTLTLRTR